MIEALSTIAISLGIAFSYGDSNAHNRRADHVPAFPELYSEGYVDGGFRLDDNGDLMTTYTLSLWVLTDSLLSDEPATRQIQLGQMLSLARQVYRKLSMYATVQNATFGAYTNVTDRNLDGIRFQFQATPLIQAGIC